jgi:hypothetical protein
MSSSQLRELLGAGGVMIARHGLGQSSMLSQPAAQSLEDISRRVSRMRAELGVLPALFSLSLR